MKAISVGIENAKELASKAFMQEFNKNVAPFIRQWLKATKYDSVEFSMGTYLLKKNGKHIEEHTLPDTHKELMHELNETISYSELYSGKFEFYPSK